MGREIINSIECGNCRQCFDVATEDLEWEHLSDIGERDDDTNLHDFAIWQKVECPYCQKANDILFKAIGYSNIDLIKKEVMSMETSVLMK